MAGTEDLGESREQLGANAPVPVRKCPASCSPSPSASVKTPRRRERVSVPCVTERMRERPLIIAGPSRTARKATPMRVRNGVARGRPGSPRAPTDERQPQPMQFHRLADGVEHAKETDERSNTHDDS